MAAVPSCPVLSCPSISLSFSTLAQSFSGKWLKIQPGSLAFSHLRISTAVYGEASVICGPLIESRIAISRCWSQWDVAAQAAHTPLQLGKIRKAVSPIAKFGRRNRQFMHGGGITNRSPTSRYPNLLPSQISQICRCVVLHQINTTQFDCF